MTFPFDDPSSRWGLIFHHGGMGHPLHSFAEWAAIADAIEHADTQLAAAAGPAVVRGDQTWCRWAVQAYQTARDTDPAQSGVDQVGPVVCRADERLVRAFMDAPWFPPGPTPQTMAQACGFDAEFPPGHPAEATSLIALVDNAQHLGVFGAPDHHIALWHWIDLNHDGAGLVVTVTPPDGAGYASPPVAAGTLAPVGATPTEAIVANLQAVADVANRLLAAGDHDHGAAVAWRTAAPARGRAFPAAANPATKADAPPGEHPLPAASPPPPAQSTPPPRR